MSDQQEEIDDLKKKLEKLEKLEPSSIKVIVKNDKPMKKFLRG